MIRTAYISMMLIMWSSMHLVSQDGLPMIDQTISTEKIQEIESTVDITKIKKVWRPRRAEGDSSQVNSRGQANAQEVQPPRQQRSFDLKFLGWFLYLIKYTLIILLIGTLAYAVVALFRNIQEGSDEEVIVEDLILEDEEDIHELDLDQLLREALESKNYKNAIRARFLILLKGLSEDDMITWSIEKTNREYLRELRAHSDLSLLREAFNSFDIAWYGDKVSDIEDYERYTNLLQRIQLATPQEESIA